MSTTATNQTTPAKLRAAADSMQRRIDDLGRPRASNTPKRQREAMQRRNESRNLEAARDAALLIAEAIDAGSLPAEFAAIKTRAEVERLTRRVSQSLDYYTVVLSDDHAANDTLAVAFRAWVKAGETERDAQRRRDADAKRRVAMLEERVRFANIDGFFPTPQPVIERMLAAADVAGGMLVLEPSAGKGDLAEAIRNAGAGVECVELNHALVEILHAKGLPATQGDFLTMPPRQLYDRVVMNPPFERGADRKHVRAAFEWLRSGGRLVSVMAASVAFDRASDTFRNWVDDLGGTIDELPENSFRDAFRSTSVRCVLLTLDKPAGREEMQERFVDSLFEAAVCA